MSLVPPILDDRRFDDLRKEALERIQREFPQWTDHNASDPGVTLLELFAWFTELMLFRMNQLPDKLHGELLSLLGMRPTPAQAAAAIVEFRPDPPNDDGTLRPELPDAVVIPRHTQSERISLDGGKDVVFETDDELALVRRPLVALRRRSTGDGGSNDLTQLNGLANRGFDPFGPVGAEGSELRLRIKALQDDRLSDVFPEMLTFHAALAEPVAGSAASVVGKPQLGQPSAAELVWEARLADAEDATNPERWERLVTIVDETAAFARDGFIRIGRPRRAVAHSNESGKYLAFELRCRVAKPFAFGRAPRLWHLAINAVTAHAYGTEKEQDLGASNGLSGQSFTLRKQPVEPGSVRLITRQEGSDEQSKPDGGAWVEAADFSLAGPQAPENAVEKAKYNRRAFVVDPSSGRITFGDGEYGEIPKAGERVVALTYRSGGGILGNVSAGAIKFTKPQKYSGVNPLPASGGRDAESASALRQRAPARLRSRDRAVTTHDYEAIACAEGGMARAQAVSGLHPDFPELEGQMPGALTVFVVAPLLKGNRAPPWPSNLDLEHVECELEQRRMIGSEVFVRAAQIVPVKVTVSIRRASGIGAENATAAIRSAINAWLNDEARGFGAKIYATEIWSEIAQSRNRDMRVVAEMISLEVDAGPWGAISIESPGDDQAKPKITVFGATADATNVLLRLPDHAVPWGGEDHVVSEGRS